HRRCQPDVSSWWSFTSWQASFSSSVKIMGMRALNNPKGLSNKIYFVKHVFLNSLKKGGSA
ncbi:MAG: hypothetical protein ACPL4H_10830, partial [Anaerolineales bacterium]